MTITASREEIAAATGYERSLVPALIEEWCGWVADAARIRPGDRLLDVACGTGILTREAARRAGTQGSVTGLDPTPGMLAVAGGLAPDIAWKQGTAEALPFPDGSFDVVVSQFGMMFFSDRALAAREMLRVLAPAGRLAVAVWDALEHNPGYADEVAMLDRVAGAPAGDAIRMPYAFGDPRALAAVFEEAGAESVATETASGTARFPNVRTMIETDVRGWMPVVGVHLDEPTIARVFEEAERALAPHVGDDGTVSFETSAHVVTARRP